MVNDHGNLRKFYFQSIQFQFQFTDEFDAAKPHHAYRELPNIITNPPCDKEVAILFRTAVQCWQLLQSNEILQMDFKQLLLSLPCSPYVNQFLVDLAFYLGQPEEAQTLLNDSTLGTSSLEKNLRYLSLTLHQTSFQVSTCFTNKFGSKQMTYWNNTNSLFKFRFRRLIRW